MTEEQRQNLRETAYGDLSQFIANNPTAKYITVPSALSPTGADIATRLKQLESLKLQGLITETEYAEKRAAILAEL